MSATRNVFRAAGVIVLVALGWGCASHRPPHTDVVDGRLLDATRRTVLVEVRRGRNTIDQLSLHLGPDAHTFANNREINVTQIPVGSEVKIYRDSTTHRVVRIDMDQPGAAPNH